MTGLPPAISATQAVSLSLHPKQFEVLQDSARFKVVVAGRRFGKCLHAGTMISMADGSERPVEQVRAGDVVLTVNEDTYLIEPRTVQHVHDNGVRDTVIVSTAGRSLRCTPNHPLLVNNRWVNAGEIKPGDLVAVPKRLAFGNPNVYLPISCDEFVQHLKYEPVKRGKFGGYNCAVSRDLPDELRDGLTSWRKQNASRVSKLRYEALRGYSDGFFDPIADGEVAWEEVKSVEAGEKGQTWDLTVEGNHNFIAEGIVTHNTFLARAAIIKMARVQKRRIWYVAPSYRMAKQIMWSDLLDALPKKWIVRVNETAMRIELINRTVIELKGADKPDSLRGVGLHFLVMDEFQDMRGDVWTKVLRPTLTSTGGHALFIGCVNERTKVLHHSGICAIKDFSKGSPTKTLDNFEMDLYGLDRTFHRANGFWNNGTVPTRKLKTHMGFEIEASMPHPVWTIDKNGTQGWKKTEDIQVGDRVAIARGMEVWGNKDPLEGWSEHVAQWRKTFEGKRGPKPKAINHE